MRAPRIAVVGGGIVGLAVAWRLAQARPDAAIKVLEKEGAVARHQSGRNSGVLHSGLYYEPGSVKARLCREGKAAMERFCDERGVRRAACGKVVVAAEEAELGRLAALHERGRANGVDCERVGPERLRELEPHAAGIAAIHVPETGIVDYPGVARELAALLAAGGHEVRTGVAVRGARPSADGVVLATSRGELEVELLVACAGLHSDRVARASGLEPPARIVPFRGEFFELVPEKRHLCRGRISPVPDPRLPFLGPHVTPTVHGTVQCGPNAVLAAAREGYAATDVDPRDILEALAWPGFRRLAARNWRTGYAELARSLSREGFARACRRLVPEIRAEDLVPCAAGVRAQAVSADGELVDDFLVLHGERAVHVVNAPSPAATAALAIGAEVAREAVRHLG
jgi:L-2-hydroxyglutarate oxidase